MGIMKSVSGKVWQQRNINEYYVLELKNKLGISDLLARILSSRVPSIEAGHSFLSSKIKHLLPDPFHLLDMDKAVDRTIAALTKKEKIFIFADYDVDGATSSALLKNIFRDLNHDVEIYVPDRIEEGYGPSEYSFHKIKDFGAQLVITVDCGTSSYEALKYAKQIGLDIIVIDHHISTSLPLEPIAIVNPNRIDETSSFTYLAAVGVSFLFAAALLSELKKQSYFHKIQPPNLLQYLDLVALGTVCDVMPITDLNRAFVSQGLKVMKQRLNIGIKILCDIAGIAEALNCYHLGFILGPRINAGGRVGKSNLGANLLSTTLESEAHILAAQLEKHNNERKVMELVMIEQAIAIAENQNNQHLLFIVGHDWHAGVIGIIAGRLKEKFNKPVAVIALVNGVGKASCRSITGIDFGKKIIEAKNKGLVVAGGGHAMAAGFTVTKDKLAELEDFLNNLFAKDFANSTFDAIEEYEAELTPNSLNMPLLEELNILEPFGNGNPEPIFRISSLFVLKADIIAGKHIRCLLAPSKDSVASKTVQAIAFNATNGPIETALMNKKALNIDAIGSLKINSWQEQKRIQLNIKDLIVNK
jgi:single-stranded-DNA-specific exonuclease